MDNKKVKKDLLNEVYLTIYDAVDENEEIFNKIVSSLSGDQWNFPEHIYSRQKVQKYIAKIHSNQSKINVDEISEETGYGKRWIKNLLRKLRN